jgi:hypothetical protein
MLMSPSCEAIASIASLMPEVAASAKYPAPSGSD